MGTQSGCLRGQAGQCGRHGEFCVEYGNYNWQRYLVAAIEVGMMEMVVLHQIRLMVQTRLRFYRILLSSSETDFQNLYKQFSKRALD